MTTIAKLESARRQLDTAIRLWFEEGDPVSIHTLACAAYEIIHVISKKRNRARDLLFDSLIIKDEYRREANAVLKKPANFFKHARNDADASIEFHPTISELFILFSILGLELSGEQKTDAERAFLFGSFFKSPSGSRRLGDSVS